MAYTPTNNPYIPGDPYSYDLKWLVTKVKTALSSIEAINKHLANIDDNIDQIINDTILEMLNDGTLNVQLVTSYDADTEALTISMLLS